MLRLELLEVWVVRHLFKQCICIKYSDEDYVWVYDDNYYKSARYDLSEESGRKSKSLLVTITIIAGYIMYLVGVDYLNLILNTVIDNRVIFYSTMNVVSLLVFIIGSLLGRFVFVRRIQREGVYVSSFSGDNISLEVARREKKETFNIIIIIVLLTVFVVASAILNKELMLDNPSLSVFEVIILSIVGFLFGTQSWVDKYQLMSRIIDAKTRQI